MRSTYKLYYFLKQLRAFGMLTPKCAIHMAQAGCKQKTKTLCVSSEVPLRLVCEMIFKPAMLKNEKCSVGTEQNDYESIACQD